MISPARHVSVSELRAALSDHLRFVREQDGMVYIRAHRRRMGVIVPVWKGDTITDVDTFTIREMKRRQDESLRAWQELRRRQGYTD